MSRAQPGGLSALLSDYRQFAGPRLWLALALMILGALAEGFSLLMIVPLATIAVDGSEALLRFAPLAAGLSGEQRLFAALALFATAMAARSLLLYLRDVLLSRLQAEYEADLRLRAAITLAGLGWPAASRIGQAGMQSLLLNDVPRTAQAVAHLQNIAVGAMMLAVQLGLTFLLSPALTMIAVGVLAAAALVSNELARRGTASGMNISSAMSESADSGFRLHAGLKAALAQGTVAAFIDEYGSSLQRTARQFTEFARDYSAARQWAAFGAALAACLLLFMGLEVLSLPFPVLVASLVLFARMSAPAQQLQSSALQAAACAPAFAAIKRRLGSLSRHQPSQAFARPLEWSELRLEQVTFRHQSDIGVEAASLRLRPGEWVGVQGASGAGKTTLLDLVAGLIVPQRGSIELDGRPIIGNTLEGWRSAMAYVGQEPIVFNDSIRGNLRAEAREVGEAELWKVLKVVGLDSRIRSLPEGLDVGVGDRGSRLSGGERQRLVIARALLRRPTLLILDEATAALDPEAEAALIDRLKALQPRPAALVVAHRESTLSHCDTVISIQHGVVKPTDLASASK